MKHMVLMIGIIYIFTSCEENVKGIILKDENRYMSISEQEVIEVFQGDSLKVVDNNLEKYEFVTYKDTIKTILYDNDIREINKSFHRNGIYKFNDKEYDIGKKVDFIQIPRDIVIKTNKRELKIKYNYFINNKNPSFSDKTERFDRFMYTIDSILYYKGIR